jgi:hypothetical protein
VADISQFRASVFQVSFTRDFHIRAWIGFAPLFNSCNYHVMKRGIIIGLAVVVTLVIVSFILNMYLEKQRNFGKYKTLPDFPFLTLYDREQNTSDLPKYKGYVVLIFNPGCEICKEEATEYYNHNDSMQNILFVMLSSDSIAKIKEFALKQQLYNTDNFIFGHIEKKALETKYRLGTTNYRFPNSLKNNFWSGYSKEMEFEAPHLPTNAFFFLNENPNRKIFRN